MKLSAGATGVAILLKMKLDESDGSKKAEGNKVTRKLLPTFKYHNSDFETDSQTENRNVQFGREQVNVDADKTEGNRTEGIYSSEVKQYIVILQFAFCLLYSQYLQ